MNAAYFGELARYNAWANERLYAACGELADAERKAPRPAFFGSIHRTLNHLLVADRIWVSRLVGEAHGISSLDQELYQDFNELRAARGQEDRRLITVVAVYHEAKLAGELAYRNMAGEDKRTPLLQLFGHMFNHQTHHRGQVHGMLSGTSVAPPPLDLLYMPWKEPRAGV